MTQDTNTSAVAGPIRERRATIERLSLTIQEQDTAAAAIHADIAAAERADAAARAGMGEALAGAALGELSPADLADKKSAAAATAAALAKANKRRPDAEDFKLAIQCLTHRLKAEMDALKPLVAQFEEELKLAAVEARAAAAQRMVKAGDQFIEAMIEAAGHDNFCAVDLRAGDHLLSHINQTSLPGVRGHIPPERQLFAEMANRRAELLKQFVNSRDLC